MQNRNILLGICETPYFQNLVAQYRQIKSRVLMSPSVLRRCILAPYVPLRATCSASVPCVDLSILRNGRLEKLSSANAYLFPFSGNCANIIATNIKTHPINSLLESVSCKSTHPASTEITDSILKIRDATVGFIPSCPTICSV